MGCYGLSESVNQLTDDILNSYALHMFVYNPIIAAMIVTFVTMAIYQLSKRKNNDDIIRIYIISAFVNVCYLFFHIEAMKRKLASSSVTEEMFTDVRNEGDLEVSKGFEIDDIKQSAS